jgi:hypothetical protein
MEKILSEPPGEPIEKVRNLAMKQLIKKGNGRNCDIIKFFGMCTTRILHKSEVRGKRYYEL